MALIHRSQRLAKLAGLDPPTPEKRIERDVVLGLRGIGFDVVHLSQPRASMQTPGTPDLYVRHVAWGMRLWVEVKRRGGRVSPQQQAWHDAERAAGGVVLVVTSAHDAMSQVAALREAR